MPQDITIIYYTSNTEKSDFENQIIETLKMNCSGLPIISVSHKPMTLGINICVGEVGRSSYNQWRQLQIGASTARTRFVALAESDFLYPKEHFNIIFDKENVFYAPLRVYQLCSMKNRLHKYIPMHRRYREGTSIVGREYLLETLDSMLGINMWRPGIEPPFKMPPHLFTNKNVSLYKNSVPLVTFRTDAGMHQHIHDDHPSGIDELSPWGRADELIERFHA